MTERRTASAVISALGSLSAGSGESDREFIAAQARDDRIGTKLFVKRCGNGSQEPLAHLIAMLIVDRFEAMHLDRDDDQIVAASAGFRAQALGAVGKTLAVQQSGCRVGNREDRRAALAVGAKLGLVLQIDVAPPAEQDQSDVQRHCGQGDLPFASEIGAGEAQRLEQRVAVPHQAGAPPRSGSQGRAASRRALSRRERVWTPLVGMSTALDTSPVNPGTLNKS